MKSTKTINKYRQPDLKQECPDWKAGILTTTLTVLAGRDNYIYSLLSIEVRELYLR